MPNPILTISIKGYVPKTYGSNDVARKEELRDIILSKISNLAEIQKNCRGKRLSLDVCFNLFSDTDVEGRKTKDLDNLLKIFCDVLPEFVDRGKTIKGLGLIEEDRLQAPTRGGTPTLSAQERKQEKVATIITKIPSDKEILEKIDSALYVHQKKVNQVEIGN